jgi:hypothetical protein
VKTDADQISSLGMAIQTTGVPDLLSTRTRTRGGGGGKGGPVGGVVTEADTGEGAEVSAGKEEKEDRNYVKVVCRCSPPAVIRVSSKTLERRKIRCGDCMESLALEQSD